MTIPLDYSAVQRHYAAQKKYDKDYAHIPSHWRPRRPQVGGLLYYPNDVVRGPNGEVIEWPNYADEDVLNSAANDEDDTNPRTTNSLPASSELPQAPALVRRYSYERPEELAKLKPPTLQVRPAKTFKCGKTLVVVGFG